MRTRLEDLVFSDVNTPISKLISAAEAQEFRLLSKELIINNNSSQSDGTIWSPQLDSYKEWISHHDKIQELGFRQAAKEDQENASTKPYDLLSSGSLHFGSAEGYRQKIIEEALKPKKNEEKLVQKNMHNFEDLQAGLIFKEEADCFVLSELNLHALARYLGTNKDIVIMLPDFIDDKPLREISANACIRRNSQGVQVKLLYLGDELKKVAQGALSSIQCEHIHIGKKLIDFKAQAFSRSNYADKKQALEISVNDANPNYMLVDNYLLTQDETELIYAAEPSEPYPSRLELPSSIRIIHPHSFIEDAILPELVVCPPLLEAQKSKALESALWVCEKDLAMYETLRMRGVRLASHEVIKEKGCYYDVDNDFAALVLGPRPPLSASKKFARTQANKLQNQSFKPNAAQADQTLSLPSSINAKPLKCIKTGALLSAPKTLIIPDSVEIIEDQNLAKGLERLILSRNLKSIGEKCFCSRSISNLIDIPASVHSIGEASFEFCKIRFEQVHTIVHISQDQMKSCFIEAKEGELPFNFRAYDEILISNTYLPDKLGALLSRLAGDYPLDKAVEEALVNQLLSQRERVYEKVAQSPDSKLIDALIQSGFIRKSTIDELLNVLQRYNRKNEIIALMDYKQTHFAFQKADIKSKFDL